MWWRKTEESSNALTPDEVYQRVSSYPAAATDVTNVLYDFGRALLNENQERTGLLDSKATTVAGFSGAILALLLSDLPTWSKQMTAWQLLFTWVATICAFLASAFSLVAMRGQHWEWFSDKDWFREGVLDDADKLKRYHLTVLHEVNSQDDRVNERKGTWLIRSQFFLASGGGALAVALFFYLLPNWLSSLLQGTYEVLTRYLHALTGSF